MRSPLAGRATLVAAALLCRSPKAIAQGWEGGVKSGVSRAGLTASGEFDWSYAPTSAVFAKHRFAGPFAIQPELVYVRRAGVSNIAGSTLTMTADNVELPVMVNLNLPSALGVTSYFSAGPNFAFRLRCRLQFLGGGLRTSDACDGGGTRSSRVDLGVAGGAGIGWSVGAMTLVMEGRVATGLRTYVLPTDVGGARSMSWSVLAGVSTPLNRQRPVTSPPVRLPPIAAGPGEATVPARAPLLIPSVPVVATSPLRLTVTADDVDVHDIIEGIAKATGFKVIVGTQVHKRVSAALYGVTAEEAIQEIVAIAGLTIIRPDDPGQAIIVVQNKSGRAATTKP